MVSIFEFTVSFIFCILFNLSISLFLILLFSILFLTVFDKICWSYLPLINLNEGEYIIFGYIYSNLGLYLVAFTSGPKIIILFSSSEK